MPFNKSGIGEVVKKYLSEYGPEMPSLRLAKIIAAKEPGFSVNSLRMAIGYARGKSGDRCRKLIKDRRFLDKEPRSTNSRVPGRSLPDSYAETWEPFRIAHAGGLRVLLLSDIHFPYHDTDALNAALDHGHTLNPNVILLNGDLQDCHEFGVYERDPRKRHVAHEIDCVRKFLALLREEFPLARIIWKLGNHEERWTRWMMRMAPQLLDIKEFDLYSIMQCAESGVEIVSDKRVIQAGKLNILHGHEYAGSGGVNPARWLYLRTGESAICGHFHRTSEHVGRTIGQDVIGAWSMGCLSELHPAYRRLNEWSHGFAFVTVGQDGSFRVQNYRIINGTVY